MRGPIGIERAAEPVDPGKLHLAEHIGVEAEGLLGLRVIRRGQIVLLPGSVAAGEGHAVGSGCGSQLVEERIVLAVESAAGDLQHVEAEASTFFNIGDEIAAPFGFPVRVIDPVLHAIPQ